MVTAMIGRVVAVSRSEKHAFSKPRATAIRLIAGLGVEGDAHLGVTVQHRSRVRADPTQPNLRQVHLIHAELFDELAGKGFVIAAGELGENITTSGVALLDLPTGARLRFDGGCVIEVTGLRNPCHQIEAFRPGLVAAVLSRNSEGGLVRKAGVMGIVIAGGEIREGHTIEVMMPQGIHRKLEVV